jgi:hypothetical protein
MGTRLTSKKEAEPSSQECPSQGKRPEDGRFRLQVDRQTKASFATFEEAEPAGRAVKEGHPVLQVAVYDGLESVNKIIAAKSD